MDQTPDLRQEKRYCSRIGFALAIIILGTVVFQFLLEILIAWLAPHVMESSYIKGLLLVLPYLFVLPLAWKCLAPIPQQKLPDRPVSPLGMLRYFLIAFAMMEVGSILGAAISSFIFVTTSVEEVDLVSELVNQLDLSTIILCVCILAPIAEELIFRKMIAGRLMRYGEKRAILYSALLFGLFHGNISQFVYAFFIGLLFGYVYIRSGRIWNTIALHTMLNFTGSALPLAAMRSEAMLISYSGFMLLCTVIGISLFFQAKRRVRLDDNEIFVPAKIIWLNPGMITAVSACICLFFINFFL